MSADAGHLKAPEQLLNGPLFSQLYVALIDQIQPIFKKKLFNLLLLNPAAAY